MKIPRLLFCLFLSIAFLPKANSEEIEPAEAKASLFTSRREVFTEATLVKLAPEATVKVTKKSENLISYEVMWTETSLTLNIDEEYDQTTQNEGMLGWLAKLPKEEMDDNAAVKLKAYIPSITRTYGIVLPKGFDGTGKCSALLLNLCRDFKGYAFTDNSFYDSSGFRMIGLPTSSPFFGRAGRNLMTLDGAVSPKELLTGKWEVDLTAKSDMEDAEMCIVFQSVDEYLPTGAFLSTGTAAVTITREEIAAVARMGFSFMSQAKWMIDGGCAVVEGEKMKTSKPWCKPPEFKEMLDGIVEGLTEESEARPESHWIICREKDYVLLQEKESGLTVSMKRQKK